MSGTLGELNLLGPEQSRRRDFEAGVGQTKKKENLSVRD